MNIEIEYPPVFKIGDLVKLDTPDNDDGKVVLITGESSLTGSLFGVIVGEVEQHAYLPWELKRL